ncbi:hypothetical protein CLV45_2183 [Hymenobacter chitinivorans DSM 11115]|uniref:Uncharacterized protein n=1 Tax=Hymenobacter chitinivorans DSM 11115 TaxID=1121954 RepID=A0A2M9BS79_9BACT|nr:hypothetical protein CLV45_2183 [Hymenobacter chitinivorans DSM 11115]
MENSPTAQIEFKKLVHFAKFKKLRSAMSFLNCYPFGKFG